MRLFGCFASCPLSSLPMASVTVSVLSQQLLHLRLHAGNPKQVDIELLEQAIKGDSSCIISRSHTDTVLVRVVR